MTKISKSLFFLIISSSLVTGCSSVSNFIGTSEVFKTDSYEKVNNKLNIVEVFSEENINMDYTSPIKLPPSSSLDLLTYEKFSYDSTLSSNQIFPEKYTDLDGIFTFRGNNLRDSASFGKVDVSDLSLEKKWEFITGKSGFGAGAGWTGQPSIIKWPEEVKHVMNIEDKFKYKEDFVEVIYGSLDGRVYFFDLYTGEPTRPSIDTGNPIKGSVSIDPRGYPILYVGHGVPERNEFGHKIFRMKYLFFM